MKAKTKKVIKKVAKGLQKASKTHAGQAKSLSALKLKAGGKGGNPGQWSGRKAQMLAKQYKAKGGGYR